MSKIPSPRHCALALLWLCGGVAQAAEPDMFWFKNATECAGAQVTVRSYCEVSQHANAVQPRNAGCTGQRIVIARPGHKQVTRDLLEHEPVADDFHVASSLRCVAAGGQHYLLVTLDTGGSCDSCELQAVLGLDGRWKRYGKQWQSTSVAEQRAIRQSESGWRQAAPYQITNTVRDAQAEQ